VNASDITLCMIVKDEEEALGRCLASVEGLVSEIVVVDAGSADRTREIALSFGAIVVSAPWTNDFAAARNLSLSLASRPWILVLDADEELAPASAEAIRLLAAEADRKGKLGFQLRIVSFVGAGDAYETDSVCRLFRNDPRIRFAGAVHEEAASSILRLSTEGLEDAGGRATIRHFGYLDRTIAAKRKNERNLALVESVLRQGTDNPFWLYALGTEYVQLGRYAEAAEAYGLVRSRLDPGAGYYSDYLLKLVHVLREMGKSAEAAAAADEALEAYPDFPDLLELRALLALDAGEGEAALAYLGRALAEGDRSDRYSSGSGAGTYRTRYALGRAYERIGRPEKAAEAYREALRVKPGYPPALAALAALEPVG